MFTNAGVFASLALAANAILVPPNLAADGLGDDNALEVLAVNPFKRTVALACPGCGFATAEGNSLAWTQDTGSSLLLDFEVGPREDTLGIDGVQLFPPQLDHFAEPFYVTQVDPKREPADALRLRVTGYTFHYSGAETVTETGTELLPMTFRITSIESKSVDPPALTINLLKDANGRLMIASFQPGQAGKESSIEEEKECKEWPLLCKWKGILADKVNGVKNSIGKGCHSNKGNPMAEETTDGKPPHRFRPGHAHPHHRPHHFGVHGHHHHHHNRIYMFLRRVLFTILIPSLIGIFASIFAGTLACLLGMAAGCLIAVVMAKIRGHPSYETIAQDDDEAPAEPRGEKEMYAELPDYEAPPVYEEAAEKEVVEGH